MKAFPYKNLSYWKFSINYILKLKSWYKYFVKT